MPDEGKQTDPAPPKVVTEHEEANGAIDALRDIAKTLKEVGDENVRLNKSNNELFGQVNALEEESVAAADLDAQLESWRTSIADHERGIIDTDELYAKTIKA